MENYFRKRVFNRMQQGRKIQTKLDVYTQTWGQNLIVRKLRTRHENYIKIIKMHNLLKIGCDIYIFYSVLLYLENVESQTDTH